MKINPYLVQDCNITEADLKREDVRNCYIARVLTKGTWQDLHDVGLDNIEKYLKDIVIPDEIREFWNWYFSEGKKYVSDNRTTEKAHCHSV